MKPSLFLGAAAFLAYGGPRITALGFQRDDWSLLYLMKSASAPFAVLRALAHQEALIRRPLNVLMCAIPYWLFGEKPLGWIVSLAVINTLSALAVYGLLRKFRAPKWAALLAATAFLAWPSKDTALFWAGYTNGPLALLAFLAGYLLHLDYIERPRPWKLAAGCASFLICFTSYDSCVFLLPILLLTPRPAAGVERARQVRSTLLLGATVAGTMLLRGLIMRHLSDTYVSVDFYHVFFVYLASLNANFGPDLAVSSLRAAARAFSSAPAVAAAALLLPALALRADGAQAPADPDRAALRRLIALGAAVYVLGYLAIAVSLYVPAPTASENRLNLVPVAGLAFAFGGWLSLRRRSRAAMALAALAVGGILAASVGAAASWAEAYRRQLAVRDLVLEHLPEWPRGDVLFLRLPELNVDGRASVFDYESMIDPAVRLWTGDPQRRSYLLRPGVEILPDGFRLDGKALFRYDRLVYLDAADGAFIPHPAYDRLKDVTIPPNIHNPVATWARHLMHLRHPSSKS